MNKVEKLFIKRGVVIMRPSNKWFVMSKQNSIEFIDACEKEQIQLLGIDGFYLHENGGIEPSMSNSIDYSPPTYKGDKSNLYNISREFILSRDDSLFFEIVCAD